jgi:hypothetical protein
MVAMWLVAESCAVSPLILQQQKYRFRPQPVFQASVSAHILQHSTSDGYYAEPSARLCHHAGTQDAGAMLALTERQELGLLVTMTM